jgi:septum formation protein
MNKILILASNSPRRVELLKNSDIKFEVVSHKFDESTIKITDPVKLVKTLSFKKAESISNLMMYENRFILGVDTIVVHKNNILGKPSDNTEAEKYIRMLSGKHNTVISGISIINKQNQLFLQDHCISKVIFEKLNENFIKYYLDNIHWEGYAGGYAIQGIFSLVIKKIVGSYTNIVGLPIEKLYKMMTKLNLFPQ